MIICAAALVCIYTCLYMHMYMHMYMYMYMYTYMYVCMYVYTYIYIYICICMYVCIYIYVCIYMYVYVYLSISLSLYIYIDQQTHTRRSAIRQLAVFSRELLVLLLNHRSHHSILMSFILFYLYGCIPLGCILLSGSAAFCSALASLCSAIFCIMFGLMNNNVYYYNLYII